MFVNQPTSTVEILKNFLNKKKTFNLLMSN